MTTREARSHGLIRGTGVSIVPRRRVLVRIAAAVSATQASTPQTASHTNRASHPLPSASAAASAISAASPNGITNP